MSIYTSLPTDVFTVDDTDAIASSLFDSLVEGTDITIEKITVSGDE